MRIIYIMDPLCGWCYGNSENTLKLYEKYKNEIDFEILPGGMWAGDNVRKQSAQMLNFFLKHDGAVADRTGIAFSQDYKDHLKEEIALGSEIPSRAIVTVKNIAPAKTVSFTGAIQKARYYFGKDLNLDETYLSIVKDLGIDVQTFLDCFHSDEVRIETQNTFRQAAWFAQSFPTMLVEKKGKYTVIEQGYVPLNELEQRIEALK